MTPTDPRPQAREDHLYAPLHNEDVAHEHSDVNVRALMLSAVGLAVVVAVCAGIVYVLFGVFERQAAARDQVVTPLATPATSYSTPAEAPAQLPPEPRLLTNEPQNLERFRAEQAGGLKGIDEAKKQLLQQGLPVRADAPTDPRLGTRTPAQGESTGGRGIPTRPGGN